METNLATIGEAIGRTKVLVIDDEFIQAERNCTVLQCFGVKECEYVTDFGDAIDLYRKMQPEIVLPDIHLSADRNRDGFALIRAMRVIAREKGWPEPYGIFITGFEVEEARERAFEIPGSILIEKPVHDTILIEQFSAVTAQLPEWRKKSASLVYEPHDWNDEFESERNALIAEEYRLQKIGKTLDSRTARRLRKLQLEHGEWLRRHARLDTSRVEAALQQLRSFADTTMH